MSFSFLSFVNVLVPLLRLSACRMKILRLIRIYNILHASGIVLNLHL